MCLARTLFLLTAMAAAALAVAGGTANAQREVSDEGSGEHCPPSTVASAHTADGGCVVELQSEGGIPLHGYVPGKVTVFSCEWHLTARIGDDGEGYVTQALLFQDASSQIPCTRTPCDEPTPSHEEIPWPIDINEAGGEESLELTFCMRPVFDAEGSGALPCTVHLEVTDLGNHDYEIGHTPSEDFCELSAPVPISIESAHFLYEEGSDKIEILH